MTLPQALSAGILLATVVLLVWGRLRFDVVAGLSLVVSVAARTVPVAEAFTGFSDQIVVTVGSALVVSAGLMRPSCATSSPTPASPPIRS